MQAWRALPEYERSIIFAAALLHDIAKPPCTQVAVDGRVISPGHARLGARFVHKLLWAGDSGPAPPLAMRAAVAGLVRYHGLPLWCWKKGDTARSLMAASYPARLDHVALVAEADTRGRICADASDLLERIALFGLLAEELACWDRPRAFANDHSRTHYFRSPGSDPNYAPFDDTVCTVTLMAGVPGAGKDSWIHQHMASAPVISLDDIRRELNKSATGNQGEVIMAAKERARDYLRHRQSFVWNATNVTRALRSQLIDFFTAYRARVRIVYVEAPFPTMLSRNEHRQHPVPEAVIAKLAGKLELPDLTEAHEVIWVEQ
jgi:predicted kinase